MARKKKGELPSGNIRRQIYNGMKQKIDKKTGEPVFDENGKPVIHRIPPYIKQLIEQVETDQLVTMSSKSIYYHFTHLLKINDMPHMSFHDLRHVNASVMSFLDIPDQYAMDRGGWTSDRIMKGTYMQIYQQERIVSRLLKVHNSCTLFVASQHKS